MAGRRAARRGAGGGEGIPAAGSTRARVATGLAALACAGATAAWAASLGERGGALAVPGLAGAALLALGLALGRDGVVPWALVLAAGGYAGALLARDAATLDPAAPLVAAGLLLEAELAYWSTELARTRREDGAVLVRRTTATLALALGSAVLGALVLVVASADVGGGVLLDVAGVAAAVAVLALIARLARGYSSSSSRSTM